VPCITSLDALHKAVSEFAVTDLDLVIEPPALAAARRSLDSSGLLLLGEMHGVRENPLLIRALMKAFVITSLALEWPDDLAPVIQQFLAGERLADHPWLWGGDGRITAGHLAVLAELAAAGALRLTLFDGVVGADWSWSQRDEAMARRILAASPPGPSSSASRWVPAWPSSGRASGETRISYGDGFFWNFEPCQFARRTDSQGPVRLYQPDGDLVLELPLATEAVVPQRPRAETPPDYGG